MTARILSLTSIPPRFSDLGETLNSLLAQRGRVDEIRLNLARSYRRFPEFDGVMPQVPNGVRVVICEEDFGPATKVLPTVAELQGQDCAILFCDDDRIYQPDWAEQMFEDQAERPECCVTLLGDFLSGLADTEHCTDHRPLAVYGKRRFDMEYRLARLRQFWEQKSLSPKGPKPERRKVAKAGYIDALSGYGGAVVRPDFFDADVFDIPEVMWTVDDVWLSGMLARAGVPIWMPARRHAPGKRPTEQTEPLRTYVHHGADRRAAHNLCVEYFQTRYGVWKEPE